MLVDQSAVLSLLVSTRRSGHTSPVSIYSSSLPFIVKALG